MNSVTRLTPQQQRDIERARELAEAPTSRLEALIVMAGGQVHGDDPYPEAFGLARNYITYLLAIIDSLTGGQS